MKIQILNSQFLNFKAQTYTKKSNSKAQKSDIQKQNYSDLNSVTILPNGTMLKTYANGVEVCEKKKVKSATKKSSNIIVKIYKNENLKERIVVCKNGVKKIFNSDFIGLNKEIFPDGTYKKYRYDGRICEEKTPSEDIIYYNPDGEEKYIKKPNGNEFWANENKTPKKIIYEDGSEKTFNKDGSLFALAKKDNSKTYFYRNGNKQKEFLPNGTIRSYFEDGTLEKEEYFDLS